jgi:hypothetical protein
VEDLTLRYANSDGEDTCCSSQPFEQIAAMILRLVNVQQDLAGDVGATVPADDSKWYIPCLILQGAVSWIGWAI